MVETSTQPAPERLSDKVPHTLAHMLGEIVWLMSQSARHKHFSIVDLEWMVMPPLLLNQFRLFHDKDRPVGCALWAFVSEDAEAKLALPIPRLRPDEWKSGKSCWLVDLIAPGATLDNKMAALMIADLQQTMIQGQTISCHRIDPKTGAKQKIVIPASDAVDLPG